MTEKQKNPRKIDPALEPVLHSWAGAISGAVSILILYPLENIKLRAQIIKKQQQEIKEKNPDEYKKLSEEQKKLDQQKAYLMNIIKDVYQNEGPCGFYKGLSALLTGNFISYGIYFYFYELMKKLLKIDPGNYKGYILASSLAGSFTSIGTNPFWVINTRMSYQKDNKGFFQTLTDMVKNEGIQSLYKGLSASLFLVINPIIQFTVYEFFKSKIRKDHKFQFLLFFLAGAISKSIATFATFPTQVLRTHQHMDKSEKKQNYLEIFKKIYKQDGASGFYVGIQAKFVQSVLNSAFMLAFYESFFKFIVFVYLTFIKKKAISK